MKIDGFTGTQYSDLKRNSFHDINIEAPFITAKSSEKSFFCSYKDPFKCKFFW